MNPADEELRALLGLGPADVLGDPHVISRPDGRTGLGDAAAALPVDDDLLALVRLDPDFTELPSGLPGGASVRRWDHDARVLRVDAPALVVLRGQAQMDRDGWLLDGRREHVVVGLSGVDSERGAWERALVAANDVDIREVHRSPSRELVEALAAPEADPQVPTPEVALSPGTLAPWLEVAVARLLRLGGTHRQLAALGIVARLWRPQNPAGRREWLAAARAGQTPLARLQAFARGADPVVFRAAVPGVAAEAAALLDELEALDELFLAGVVPTARVRALLHRRDDLEGVALVFRLAARDDVESSVGLVDIAATEFGDVIAQAGVFNDDRLAAAAVDAPEAWWAALVR